MRGLVYSKNNSNKKVDNKNNNILKNFLISPSLSIMKPNLNSMCSIFNRIFGVSLFFLINIILIYVIYINLWDEIVFDYVDFKNIFINNIIFASFAFSKNFINDFIIYNIILLFISILIYHIIYSSFKIYTKSEKIYQIISSDVNVINKLYKYILKLIFILSIFLILSFSITLLNKYFILSDIYNLFIQIIFIKLFIYILIKYLNNKNMFKKNLVISFNVNSEEYFNKLKIFADQKNLNILNLNSKKN